jgi:hypothetical protein
MTGKASFRNFTLRMYLIWHPTEAMDSQKAWFYGNFFVLVFFSGYQGSLFTELWGNAGRNRHIRIH